MTPLLTSIPGDNLDEMARNSIRGAMTRKPGRTHSTAPRNTLLGLQKAGYLRVCNLSDWSVSRDGTERLGIRGKWSPYLAYIAYLLRDRVDEGGKLKAIHLGPGDVKLLEDLEARHVAVRDLLPEDVIDNSSAPILDQTLDSLWEHYGVADAIYMEMTTILSMVLPTPERADRTLQKQMQELRRYFALSILHRAQHDTPQGKNCARALENITDIFEIVRNPQNYGFDEQLGMIPVPGEFEEENFETPTEALKEIWAQYRVSPQTFLQRIGAPSEAISLRDALAHSASSHHLLLTKFEHLQLPAGSADLITSIRGDSHLSDGEYGKMLDRTIFRALKEGGVYMSDGVMASYTRFHTRRLLALVEAARKSATQRGYPMHTGLVLTHNPFNGAQRTISSVFATPAPSIRLDLEPLLQEGSSVVSIASHIQTISFAVSAVLEAVIADMARHQGLSARQIMKGKHPTIEGYRSSITNDILRADSSIVQKLTAAGLPQEDLAALIDPNKNTHDQHPLWQLTTRLRADFAGHKRVIPL